VFLKIVPKADHECTLEKKSTKESEEKQEQKFDPAFETIFRITNCFQRSKQKLYIFSLDQGRLKI
jgi:hypothetical protein